MHLSRPVAIFKELVWYPSALILVNSQTVPTDFVCFLLRFLFVIARSPKPTGVREGRGTDWGPGDVLCRLDELDEYIECVEIAFEMLANQ